MRTFKGKGYQIKAKGSVGEIFIDDDIGEGMFDEGITAKSFRNDLARLGDVSELRIFINSGGGSVFDGIAIFNQIARHKARKVVHVDGIAASIASVIAMAGDEILIAENGMMMIHSASGVTMGTAADHRETAEALDRVDGSIVNTYVNRTGAKPDDIRQMMAATTWMTAQEAVELGFADKVSDPIDIAACVRGFDLKGKNAPAQLVEASNVIPLAVWTGKSFKAAPSHPKRPKTHPLVDIMRRTLEERGIERGASPAKVAAR